MQVNLRHIRKIIDILQRVTANMGNGVLHDLDSRLSVISDNITSNIWLAMRTIHNDTIKSALFDLVSPNEWHRSSPVIITDNLDSILMRFGYLIVEEF